MEGATGEGEEGEGSVGELMAVILLNSNIALTGPESFSGNDKVSQAQVVLVGEGVTDIHAGDQVFYETASGKIIRYQGAEYILIQRKDAIGKIV